MSRHGYWITPCLFIIALGKKATETVNETSLFNIQHFENEVDAEGSYKFHRNDTLSKVADAIQFGINSADQLVKVKEPVLFQMGLHLDDDHPASKVSHFGKPNSQRVAELAKIGFAHLEATRKIFEFFPGELSRKRESFDSFSHLNSRNCPVRRKPRCLPASNRYRTSDGTCNNLRYPWRGASVQPMQRFLPPSYEDGIQTERRSILGPPLPSPRKISRVIHRENDKEMDSLSLMFVQWGQFVDHDLTSTVKSRGFNGSVPRCCDRDGLGMLSEKLLHPSCMPIEIPQEDWLFRSFGMKCMEFIRSAPSSNINCDFGWREQINQVTSFLDGSVIYGSDVKTSDSMRVFEDGKILYGSFNSREQELCRLGALSTNCFRTGDGRVDEQPGLIALHSVWIKFHNKIADELSRFNPHWSDERIFQESRKVVYSCIQHITYNEYLPVLLGPEVMNLFELELNESGFYDGYNEKADATIANSFSTAAYRFGHSMIQNSYVRVDSKHRLLPNNVSLHEEIDNFDNIWTTGSLEHLILGLCTQPPQRRDEFVCNELSNHLFQPAGFPFGMDLAAINIQRGRDHGIPTYVAWRKPCGLSEVKNWNDLKRIFSHNTIERFRSVYLHVEDIDLFSGGLAEKNVRGGVVGPTFACIIAQQFSNLRKGDRFWYENDRNSSFSPKQLRQIRKVTLAKVLCKTMDRIETIQPFVLMAPNELKNAWIPCDSPFLDDIEFSSWFDEKFNPNNKLDSENRLFLRSDEE